MTTSASNIPKNKYKKQDMKDESGLSKNNSKSVRFRLRVQTEKEAEDEIKKYLKDEDSTRIS